MERLARSTKRILIDVAGFGMLGLALLFGWLPGPGGIPLLLGGLGLLSINHKWARRIRDTLIANGSKIAAILFPNNRMIQLAYDLFALCLIVSIVLMIIASQAYLTYVISGIVGVAAVCILLINRHRGQWIKARTFDKMRKA